MKKYSCASCHEIGYSWYIEAPDTLTTEQVEKVMEALTEWSDTPDQKDLAEMLENMGSQEMEENELSGVSMEELTKIKIDVSSVHRDYWVQDFEKGKS